MIVSVVLQLVGLLLVAVAAWLVYPPAAFAVVGGTVFYAGFDHERRR